MAKFLNTSAVNYYLEELIKNAQERLVLISPYLKVNDRIRELIEDKNRLKIDIRIIYGKSELRPDEVAWLKSLDFVRISFCQNLHAKCYLNEKEVIITSLNLYDFSQVNNNEMGVFVSRESDNGLYDETYQEVNRLIRISDEVRLTVEKIDKEEKESHVEVKETESKTAGIDYQKLTSSKLAQTLGLKTAELLEKLMSDGYLIEENSIQVLTDKAKATGAESKTSRYNVDYFLWPIDLYKK